MNNHFFRITEADNKFYISPETKQSNSFLIECSTSGEAHSLQHQIISGTLPLPLVNAAPYDLVSYAADSKTPIYRLKQNS